MNFDLLKGPLWLAYRIGREREASDHWMGKAREEPCPKLRKLYVKQARNRRHDAVRAMQNLRKTA